MLKRFLIFILLYISMLHAEEHYTPERNLLEKKSSKKRIKILIPLLCLPMNKIIFCQ